jgi:hypothetical protein
MMGEVGEGCRYISGYMLHSGGERELSKSRDNQQHTSTIAPDHDARTIKISCSVPNRAPVKLLLYNIPSIKELEQPPLPRRMIPLFLLHLRLIPMLIRTVPFSKEVPSITKILHHSTWLAVVVKTPPSITCRANTHPVNHLSQQTSSSNLSTRPATITHIRLVST